MTIKTCRGRFSKLVISKRVEPGTEQILHQHFSDWSLGRSKVFERKNEEIWRMSMRTDGRRGKVVVCHQNSGMKESLAWRQCVLKQEANGVSSKEAWRDHDVSYGRSVWQRGFVFSSVGLSFQRERGLLFWTLALRCGQWGPAVSRYKPEHPPLVKLDSHSGVTVSTTVCSLNAQPVRDLLTFFLRNRPVKRHHLVEGFAGSRVCWRKIINS